MDRWEAEMGRVREEKRREGKGREEKKKEKKESEKQRWEEPEKRRQEKRREEMRWEEKRREEERERVRRKKIQVREKVAKSRNTVCFSNRIWSSGGSKSRLAKAAGAETAGQWEIKNCTPLWREAHFEVKRYKTHHARTTFGNCDVEKVHAAVAGSTFRSQNVQNTPCSDHFWKLRCRKSACRCGGKHISKSKCTKHTMLGPLLEIAMSKRCTPLWREAHFEVKMYKTHHGRTTFGSWDVEKVHAVVAWSKFRSQNVQNTPAPDYFWKLRCRKSACRCGAKHLSKSKCQKHHVLEPLLDVQMSFRVAGARNCGPCQQRAKREGFVVFPKTMAVVGRVKRICKDFFSVAGAVPRDMFIRAVRRSGRWFPERCCILEPQIFRFA